MLLHHYDETPFSTFFVTQYQVMAWVLKQGGRVATVSKTFNSSINKRFEQKPDCITRNPYHCPDLPTDKAERFEWFNIMVTEDSFTKGNLESNGDFVALGRCSEEKKLDVAVRAFVDSGVDSKLHVFTNEPTLEPKQTTYYEKLKSYGTDNVIWHINESREQIFETLKKSSIFIFPSSKETFGLSAFEAASCGCRVIYGCPNSWFLDDYDVKVNNYRVPTFAKAIQGSIAPSLVEKENRKEHFQSIGSFEMFANKIKQFISGARSYAISDDLENS
jgi:glycosyltransferase involved in cell wall biosynthesis